MAFLEDSLPGLLLRNNSNTYCIVWRIAQGKLHEMTEYLDTELVTTAFGT